MLLGDVDLFELARLDKPCATVGHKVEIIKFSVKQTSHSAIINNNNTFNLRSDCFHFSFN